MLELCPNCVIAYENRDFSSLSDVEAKEVAEAIDALERDYGELYMLPGACENDCSRREDFEQCDCDCGCQLCLDADCNCDRTQEPYFSWNRCDCCGSEAGTRLAYGNIDEFIEAKWRL